MTGAMKSLNDKLLALKHFDSFHVLFHSLIVKPYLMSVELPSKLEGGHTERSEDSRPNLNKGLGIKDFGRSVFTITRGLGSRLT